MKMYKGGGRRGEPDGHGRPVGAGPGMERGRDRAMADAAQCPRHGHGRARAHRAGG